MSKADEIHDQNKDTIRELLTVVDKLKMRFSETIEFSKRQKNELEEKNQQLEKELELKNGLVKELQQDLYNKRNKEGELR